MADNFTANAGSGGATFASDDVASVQYPRVKPSWGSDGSATDTSVAAPMPVQTTIDSAQMSIAGTIVAPKFATIAASSSGNNTLVAAVTSKKIRVLSAVLVGNGAVNPKFQSGASGTDLTGLFYIAAAGGGVVLPFNPAGHFETAVSTLLNLNLSGAVAVGGCLTYIEV